MNAPADTIRTYKVVVQGMVTGVGFRYSAMREARRIGGLYGYVRNRDSQTVECVVQGPESAAQVFIEWLRRGPVMARIDSCNVSEVTDPGVLTEFTIAF
jgi:acylphosphatase